MNDTARTWWTLAQAADYLGVHPATIRRRIQAGDVKAHRVRGGNAIRLRAADVEALMLVIPAADPQLALPLDLPKPKRA